MIFQFPDSDTLRLALTSGLIPTSVSLLPAVGGTDDGGRPWVEPSVKPTRAMQAALAKLGVVTAKSHASAAEELANWLSALAIQKDADPPPLGSQTPVLFELADPQQLPVVVGEMMRLANDRQSFRWLKDAETGTGPILLRVVGPPYYTLLRALDREHGAKGLPVRAYVERSPRVWVEIGFTHPLIEKIQPQDGQMLILRSPRDWVFVEDKPFRDIYEILDFKLPHTPLNWVAADLKKRLTVPLRLIDGDRHDAELWVLRRNAVDQLDALVRDSKESLIQRLLFAVGKSGETLTAVVRIRPSKHPPPQLVLDAETYTRFLKLDNLFVPVGTKIQPLLRRDAVRKLLAEDPARINWLQPDPEKPGGFTPESLPEDAFHPLQEWVDYILDHDREALTGWAQEFRFDFDPFVCPEEESAEKPKNPGDSNRRPSNGPEEVRADIGKTGPRIDGPKPEAANAGEPDRLAEPEIRTPNQIQIELAEIEQAFLSIDGPLDHPDRLALWPEMAARNGALNHRADAALCWMNGLWELPETDPAAVRDLAWKWVQTESTLSGPRLTKTDLDRQLRIDSPMPEDLRALTAMIVWAATVPSAAAVLASRLPAIQQYLDKFEAKMSVRAIWLTRYGLACITGDALGLARTRDGVIDRLITEGLSPERDLPNFLRTAGHRDADRIRRVREKAASLHEAALKWCDECENVRQTSGHYVDLIFSFGLARLGEPAASRELLWRAEETVAKKRSKKETDEVFEIHTFLLRAFRYRIEQANLGRPHLGPLPAEWRQDVDRALPHSMQGKQGQAPSRYIIDRMREQSQILDPMEKLDPYLQMNRDKADDLKKRLAELQNVKDPRELAAIVFGLLKDISGKPPSPEQRVYILTVALPLSPRVGEGFVNDLLPRVEPALEQLPPVSADSQLPAKQAVLLERALLMASNYDRIQFVQIFVRLFVLLLRKTQRGTTPIPEIGRLFGQCLRSLRKVGLRDETSKLIEQMAKVVLQGQTVAEIRLSQTEREWGWTLQTLLHLAGGWLSFNATEKAEEILNATRELIFAPQPGVGDRRPDAVHLPQYAQLVCTYATVLGQAPVDFALSRIDELFRRMWRMRDTFTSNRYYARLHLNVIEAVVLSMVSDDFALGPGARRWLEDDESLVRRRIHRDHRAMLRKTGQ